MAFQKKSTLLNESNIERNNILKKANSSLLFGSRKLSELGKLYKVMEIQNQLNKIINIPKNSSEIIYPQNKKN
ncbi:hypothetical protein ABE04_29315 [Bacillus thuringiensis]|nr:hypothetical protein [Bacillus thuringiensis]